MWFCAKLPGILVKTDDPVGDGGRINLFSISCLSVSSGYYYRNRNEALLTINAEYDGVRKDTTFLLLPGEMEWVNENTYISDNDKFYQYAFNSTIHSTKPMTGLISEHDNKIYVEGGGGLKPVISAAEIRRKLSEKVSALGRDPEDIIINKASLILPFEAPEYTRFDVFPSILSPTCMLENTNGSFTFAGLTDASISTENQGDLNRSTCVYAPDISFHVQEILKLTNEEKLPSYDVWLLNVHSETETNASGSIYDSDYYRQLMYASYYNSLYGDGYGYGGYGYGYGGYGYNSYSNYYSYMMLAQMYANSSSSSDYTTTTELDKDRYYQAVLNGVSEDLLASPRLKVILSVPKR